MTDSKPKYESMTIISAAVVLASVIANQLAGVVIDEAAQGQLVDLITQGMAVIGGIGAWWGRVRATKSVKK